MKTPRIHEIISKLELVLENQLSREEDSDWAYQWMMISENEEGCETTEYDILVFQSLTKVHGMDRLNSPIEYLHCEEDIRDWVKEFQNIEISYHQKVRKKFNLSFAISHNDSKSSSGCLNSSREEGEFQQLC